MRTTRPGVPTVLVVGGASFVASHTLPLLAADGARVHATCRSGAPMPHPVPGVQWIPGNLAGADPAAGWPPRCDTVVYLAQSREWRQFPEGAADVFDVNVRGVFHAAEYARRAGARQFVFASTGSVYSLGRSAARERDRLDVVEPRHFYVAAKLSAELLLRAYGGVFSVVIFRLFVPYGRGESADMLIPQLVRKVQEGQPILLDGDDGLSINPVAVGDVASAIERCVRRGTSGTFNVAGPEVLTLRQVGQAIGTVLGRAPTFQHRAGEAQTLTGDTEALRAALGWAPGTSFDAGLRAWLSAAGPAGR